MHLSRLDRVDSHQCLLSYGCFLNGILYFSLLVILPQRAQQYWEGGISSLGRKWKHDTLFLFTTRVDPDRSSPAVEYVVVVEELIVYEN